MANLSSNGANYQHDGLEPLRSAPTSQHAPIIAATTTGLHATPSTVDQNSGTANLRADEKDIHAAIISGTGKAGPGGTPSTVDHFNDACV
jgi:hypothetical protein